jgi:hypothetical protein
MKAIEIFPFFDRENPSVRYNAGDKVDFDKPRIDNLVARRLVKVEDKSDSEKKKGGSSEVGE